MVKKPLAPKSSVKSSVKPPAKPPVKSSLRPFAKSSARPPAKPSPLHPRNALGAAYDFQALIAALPELAPQVYPNSRLPEGHPQRLSVDFADPRSVKLLNRALLLHHYGLVWDLPEGYLCPPIPGRLDYIHHLADLISEGDALKRGDGVRGLDIGTGANLIYPLLGHKEYGWRFVGTDVDASAMRSAKAILQKNAPLEGLIELRLQKVHGHIFKGVVNDSERFDFCMCNPPFHSSRQAAMEGTTRKLRNLGIEDRGAKSPALNFGGQGHELWCPGGEVAFLTQMILESSQMPLLCSWFTSLISKAEHVGRLKHQLLGLGAEVRVIEMRQGQKVSRILAWTFRR